MVDPSPVYLKVRFQVLQFMMRIILAGCKWRYDAFAAYGIMWRCIFTSHRMHHDYLNITWIHSRNIQNTHRVTRNEFAAMDPPQQLERLMGNLHVPWPVAFRLVFTLRVTGRCGAVVRRVLHLFWLLHGRNSGLMLRCQENKKHLTALIWGICAEYWAEDDKSCESCGLLHLIKYLYITSHDFPLRSAQGPQKNRSYDTYPHDATWHRRGRERERDI